jgi:IMP dehydrogenase
MPGIEAIHNPRTDKLFRRLEKECMDITFDDVTMPSEITDSLASEVSLDSWLTSDIPLAQPFLSAAMDTVTGRQMAITLAKAGGAGFLHAGMSADALKEEARAVKYHLNRKVEKPICARDGQSVASLVLESTEKGYNFDTYPVRDASGRLTGVLTGHNLKFWDGGDTQTVNQLMTSGDLLVTAPTDTDVEAAYKLMSERQLSVLPLLSKKGKIKAMYVWSDVRRMQADNPDNFTLGEDGRLLVVAAVETRPDLVAQRIEAAGRYIDVYAVDSSHGNGKEASQAVNFIRDYDQHVGETGKAIQFMRSTYGGNVQIIGGNVVDGRSAIRLVEAGATAIKVGIGGGSICTTRRKTGNGRLQLSAVYWVRRALDEAGHQNIPVISDGGIASEGDAAKAIAVGASSVMMGSRFAGTAESPGPVIQDNGQQYKLYRGMGSIAAQLEAREARGYTTGVVDQLLSEGVVSRIPYKGSVLPIIGHHAAGLRNPIANANARTIPEFQNNVFIRRNSPSAAREASPHVGEVGEIISN